jgi:DNA polymerase-3 subunit beta
MLLQVRGGQLTLVATDGYRLAIRRLNAAQASPNDVNLIIPARALAELVRVMKAEGDVLEVLVTKSRNQVFFRCGMTEVTSRLIDGNYPNYAQVLPSGSGTTVVEVAKSRLMQVTRAVALFAKDSANVIRCRTAKDSIILTATTNEVGDSRATFEARVTGTEVQIAFNARYMLDGLSVVDHDVVQLQLDGPLSPGLIKMPDSDEYLYVLMPVRVAM